MTQETWTYYNITGYSRRKNANGNITGEHTIIMPAGSQDSARVIGRRNGMSLVHKVENTRIPFQSVNVIGDGEHFDPDCIRIYQG